MGGNSGRFVMTAEKGTSSGSLANDLAVAAGGSLLVTDSPRTPAAAGDALQRQLSAPHFCRRWGDEGDNPYLGLLALADAFVVTGRIHVYAGGGGGHGPARCLSSMSGMGMCPGGYCLHNYRYKPLSHRLAMRFGPQRMRRDIGNIQSAMVDSGCCDNGWSRPWWPPPQLSLADAGEALPAMAQEEDLDRSGTGGQAACDRPR